jgi:hypothetical protein
MSEYKRLTSVDLSTSPEIQTFSMVIDPISSNSEKSFKQFKSTIQTYLANRIDFEKESSKWIIPAFEEYFAGPVYDRNTSSILIYAQLDFENKRVFDRMIIFSNRKNSDYINIGRYYYLIPFKHHLDKNEPALIIEVNKDVAHIFLFQNYQITRSYEVKNQYYELRSKDIDQVTYSHPRIGSSVKVGAITSAGERNEEEINVMRAFLNDIKDKIKTIENGFTKAYIFHQTEYEDVIIKYLKNESAFQEASLHFDRTGVKVNDNFKDFLRKYEELNSEQFNSEVKAMVDQARDADRFLSGKEKVMEYVDLGRVEKIILTKEPEDIPGYVLDGRLYWYPEKNATRVESFINALVHRVYKFGGEIEVVEQTLFDFDIGVILRF